MNNYFNKLICVCLLAGFSQLTFAQEQPAQAAPPAQPPVQSSQPAQPGEEQLIATPIRGECPTPDEYELSLNGGSATQEQMVNTQTEVQAFDKVVRMYLGCLQALGPNASRENQEVMVLKYTQWSNKLQALLDDFNAEVRAFNARTAPQSADDCSRPDSIQIAVDGNSANETEMMDAQTLVVAYFESSNSYLQCLQTVSQTAPPENQDMLVQLFTSMQQEQEAVIGAFNTQIQAYQARMGSAQ